MSDVEIGTMFVIYATVKELMRQLETLPVHIISPGSSSPKTTEPLFDLYPIAGDRVV